MRTFRIWIAGAIAALLATSLAAQAPLSAGFAGLPAAVFMSGIPLTGTSFPAVRGFALAATDVDLYTAPAGKRVLIMSGGGINITSTSTNCTFETKSGGTYYKISAPIAFSGLGITGGSAITYILEPGESMSVKCDAAGNVNVSLDAIQFDSSSPLKTVKILGPATGVNTLYTVPAGKTALILPPAATSWAGQANVVFGAAAVAGGLVTGCAVPSGNSAACASASAFSIGAVTSTANTRGLVIPGASATGASMAAGDMLVLGVTTGDATQIAWTNVVEI